MAACGGDVGDAAGPLPDPGREDFKGGAQDGCTPTAGSLSSDVFASCAVAGCHAAKSPAAALDLTGDLAARLIGQASTCNELPLVAAGDPDGSLLLMKLTGNVPAECGDAMPPTGANLPDAHIECVSAWIASLDPTQVPPGAGGCETCGGSACVDLTVDEAHCGACDVTCPSGASCVAGQCECSDGLEACTDSCAELATDPLNCGGCGVECGPGKLCTPTGCGTLADCGSLTVCGNACVDTTISLANCGGCDQPCSPGETCSGGACACPGGGESCGGSCVDTDSDEQNCGACGKRCVAGQTCEAGQCSCPDRVVSFDADVAPVLADNCTNAGCHTGIKPKEDLDLTTAKSFAEMVSVTASQCNDGRLLVTPGDPGNSYLVQKILGVDMCTGSQMPKAGVSLPASELEAIVAWICQGAAP